MADEGEFPKVDGDILFATEVNRFSPKVIGAVEQQVTANVSGTSVYTGIGGNVDYVGTGSLGILQFLIVQTIGGHTNSAAGTSNFRLRISGTAGLNMNTTNKTVSFDSNTTAYINHLYTSGNITASGGNIGSNYTITVEANSNINAANSRIGDLMVLGF